MFLILLLKILYSFSFGLWIEVNVLVNLKSLFIISPYFIFSELGSQRKKKFQWTLIINKVTIRRHNFSLPHIWKVSYPSSTLLSLEGNTILFYLPCSWFIISLAINATQFITCYSHRLFVIYIYQENTLFLLKFLSFFWMKRSSCIPHLLIPEDLLF